MSEERERKQFLHKARAQASNEWFTSRVPHIAHLFSSILSFSSKQQKSKAELSSCRHNISIQCLGARAR
jgi:hypothetical protein